MKFKAGVKCFGLQSETLIILMAIEKAFFVHGLEPTITSIKDGVHGSDRHSKGYAVDVRTRDDDLPIQWDANIKVKLKMAIKERLTDEFDVVIEDDHIHVEIDRRSGAV